MAIGEMKRLTLLALKKDRRRLLSEMQRMGCVEVTEAQPEGETPFAVETGADVYTGKLQRLRWALDRLSRYDTDPKPIFGTYPEVSRQQVDDVASREEAVLQAVSRLEAIERRRGELNAEETRVLSYIDELTPWEPLNLTAGDLASSRTSVQLVGTLPARNIPVLEAALAPLPVALRLVGQLREQSLIYLAVHRSAEGEALAALDSAGFTREMLSAADGRTPQEAGAVLRQRLHDIDAGRGALADEESDIAEGIRDMKVLHDALLLEQKKASAASLSAETDQTFMLKGWIIADVAEVLQQRLQAISPSAVIAVSDPGDDEEPSVLLRNDKFSAAFEPIVEGFAMPAYRSVDPTKVMAPFYATLFGMMLSDAGYGLLMAIAIPVFMKIKKIKFQDAKMLYLLAYGGVATILWGLVFNTVFGFNPIPGLNAWFPLDPIKRPLHVMGLSIAVGALHLFAGLGVAVYMNIRRRDYVAAVSDQLSWAMLIIGLGLLMLPQMAAVGKILALAGAGIIVLMGGRANKNPLKRLMSGLGQLYGISSWLSDLLSYMRLFGMGLATGVIGMVFNQLIGMVWAGGIIAKVFAAVLFVGCHLFNLGINALGAYVHSARLQYIEFFGKFFEDGGKPFMPLDMKTRFVSIDSANALQL